MLEKKRLIVGSIVVGSSLLMFGGCARQAQPPKAVPIVSPAPAATGQTVTGFAAITPTGAAITEAQVSDYVASHKMPRADTQNVAIKSVTFLNAGQLRAALQSPALSSSVNRQLVLVVLAGTFVFTGPPGTKASYPIGFEVFDAQTGHLLQFGGLPREPRTSDR